MCRLVVTPADCRAVIVFSMKKLKYLKYSNIPMFPARLIPSHHRL